MKPLLITAALAALPLFAQADEALLARPETRAFIDRVVKERGLDRAAVTESLRQVVFKPNILSILDRPSTSRPWYQFRPAHVNARLADDGAKFWLRYAAQLEAAEQRFGVDPEVIVAILGIETGYGRNMGSFRVADALATVAFDYPRRAEYFQGELAEFLQLAAEEKGDPLSYKGSYAGAMGMPQFMPSSFRKWAVDFDGNGKRDIWNSQADAIGSVANYLKLHGWQHGADIYWPANTPPQDAAARLGADKFNLHYTVAELQNMGVTPQGGLNPDALAVLYPLETAPGVTEYWLGLQNFYTITRYNKSTLYATAVAQLSGEIKQRWAMAKAGLL